MPCAFRSGRSFLALSDVATLDRLVAHSDVVAELRRAKDTPAFFMGLGGAEQRAWSDESSERLVRPADATSRSVCSTAGSGAPIR